jgi:PAS domain S-box-containing protein
MRAPDDPGAGIAFDRPRRSLSMRGYLFVMVISIFLPLVVFAAILFWRYYDSELARIEQELQNNARELTLLVDRDLEGQIVTLKTLTSSGSLNTRAYDRFYDRAERIHDYTGVNILLRDRTGQQIVNTRLPWGTPLPRDPAPGDDDVIATRQPFISNLVQGTVAQHPIYFLTVPVLENGQVSYFLHMSLELDRLVDTLKQNIVTGRLAGIVDRNNVVMARTEGFDERRGKPESPQFVERQRGAEGSWVGRNTQGELVRVGYARSKLSGWLVWVGVSEEAVQSSLRATLWRLTALGSALTVLAIGVAYLLGGRLAGASRALATQAAALGRGDRVPDTAIPVRELDDVGRELAAASTRQSEQAQQLVQAAIEESERRFQILVEGVTDYAIFMLDPDGKVTNWNSGATRIQGYTADEIVGQHFSRFHTPEDRADGAPARALLTAINEGKHESEGWRVRKDGSRFWASAVINRIEDSNGKLIGLVKITRDITERRETQQRLEAAREQLYQSQKMDAVGQLTGGVAHDFNNLLTIIIGNLDNAKRTLATWRDGAQARMERSIEHALIGAHRAATLTGHLLAFSRRQPLEPKLLDVNKLLATLSIFLKPMLGEEVQLEAVGAGGVWQVEADSAQLEASILNLAVNARDAMPNGGKLTIEAGNVLLDEAYCAKNAEVRPGQYVQISVTDDGSGMTKDVLARAFEPFFTTKQSGHGTGLGLSQVYGFVKQSGGHVKIYSEPDHGTTVHIYLPRAHGKAAEPPMQSAGIAPSAYGQEAILVVEDDDDVRAFICATLQDLNYRVLQASDARSALHVLDGEGHIDLLLSDVILPGPNGRELANAALVKRPKLKVLFMTGYSRNAIVHQGRLDEGVQLIQKPLTQTTLAAKVRDVLDMPAGNKDG